VKINQGEGRVGVLNLDTQNRVPIEHLDVGCDKPKIHDKVHYPKHYNVHPSGVECIEITRHHTFNIGNVIKYVWRAGIKDEDALLEDLEKAKWYLQDEIGRLKNLDK